MTPTPGSPYWTCPQVFAAVGRAIGIREVGTVNPFPDVTGKIKYTIRACSFRKTAYRRSLVPSRIELCSGTIWITISPGIIAAIFSTCSLFPFRLSG